ncbi:HD domain-containing protein [Zoogloea sp.]|uniref:HD domain-containing protein n=1 Tax=Zoogloea sp. TaxID=49181 RepID=UPI001ACA3761|nr:HD domain-containing protein [Zoogloea sp.]MBN8285624.1 HD domain-containing protein [Zoogloea sp.]
MSTVHPAPVTTLLNELLDIYDGRAHGRYGLSQVTQRLHAVQSAALARQRGLPAHLIVAALLHDIGHMIHTLGEHPAAAGIDDHHEDVGAEWLLPHFGPAVAETVRLHVAAKRYLCTTQPGYADRLSRDSVESLALQGGPMSAVQIRAFEAQPFWQDAVALRRIDDAAKDPDGPAPTFVDFLQEINIAAAGYACQPAHPSAPLSKTV